MRDSSYAKIETCSINRVFLEYGVELLSNLASIKIELLNNLFKIAAAKSAKCCLQACLLLAAYRPEGGGAPDDGVVLENCSRTALVNAKLPVSAFSSASLHLATQAAAKAAFSYASQLFASPMFAVDALQ